ncbi:hypothetical protein FZ103_19265 [Streptomonospora sp. PA3]|uniref:hypothetical protein n=1 Tax=Streptomonospora sp. PA3 TaxID=2607326 RepID=UPI0012DD7812|nr:hypothetical protein [Streptomonospora sp. PA3]MUL43280.1 hypothetical protein [Streptomonospora sp. PA3]
MRPPTNEEALRPLHELTGNPQDPVALYRGPIRIQGKDKALVREGSIFWDWSPTPGAHYYLDEANDDFPLLDLQLSCDDPPNAVPVDSPLDIPTEISVQQAEPDGIITDYEAEPPSNNLKEVHFLLPNFHDVIGEWVSFGTSYRRGRLHLTGKRWSFIIDPLEDLKNRKASAKRSSSYAFTHVGKIIRSDNSLFTVDEANDAAILLRHFLSFCTGRWVSPTIPVGLDESGHKVWASWKSFRSDPWKGCHQFADPSWASIFIEAYAAYEDVWLRQERHRPLFMATNYYLGANKPNPLETALSVSQSGLELLSWMDLVEEGKLLSEKDYNNSNKWPAHKKITKFLTRQKIPTQIPSHISNFSGTKPKGKKNGPELITYMRNRVIHPKKGDPKFTTDQWYSAWRLSQEYLLLGILSYIGYLGAYRSFTDDNKCLGHVAKVPWKR